MGEFLLKKTTFMLFLKCSAVSDRKFTLSEAHLNVCSCVPTRVRKCPNLSFESLSLQF